MVAQRNTSRCIQCTDNSTVRKELDFITQGGDLRDPAPKARLGTQFIEQNKRVFDAYGVSAQVQYDGRHVALELQTGDTVGAMPLTDNSKTGSHAVEVQG